MRTLRILSLLFFVGLAACNETSICPVTYNIDYSSTYTIGGNWKMIGFYKEGSNSIDYPPCEGYEKNSQYELQLYLGDSMLTVDTICNLPYEWGAYSGINWGGGRYDRDSLNNMVFGDSGCGGNWTEIAGPKEMSDYESKYASALYYAYKYEIHNNLLSIYYSSTERMIFIAK